MKQTEQDKIDKFLLRFMRLTEIEKHQVCQAIIHKFYKDYGELKDQEKEKPRI